MNSLMEPNRIIYDNFNVYSPNGELMFKANKRKLTWYLKKDLAQVISNDPLAIKLKFKPKGLGLYGKELEDIKNICCVCGTDNKLTRHHVLPHCFKKYLPQKYKSHQNTNVVCLCRDCHNQYEIKADKVKKELIDKAMPPEKRASETVLRSLAKTYFKYNQSIPIKVKDEIIKKISEILGKKPTEDDIIELVDSPDPDPYKIVVDSIEDIDEFVALWRNHFLKNNPIAYLPKHFQMPT